MNLMNGFGKTKLQLTPVNPLPPSRSSSMVVLFIDLNRNSAFWRKEKDSLQAPRLPQYTFELRKNRC